MHISVISLIIIIASLVQCNAAAAVGPSCLAIDVEGRCIEDSLYFSRVDVKTDTLKHLAIRVHGYSHESTLMSVMLMFRSPLQQNNSGGGGGSSNSIAIHHNALAISSQMYPFYYPVTHDSRLIYGNRMPVVSKSRHTVLSYDVIYDQAHWNRMAKTTVVRSGIGGLLNAFDMFTQIRDGTYTATAVTTYQAILSLDRYSATWNNHNVLLITSHEVSLHYVPEGRLDKTVGAEYSHLTRLNCKHNNPETDDNCYVKTSRIVIGDADDNVAVVTHNGTQYRLIIDLHSSKNYLPIDLYYALNALPARKQKIRFHLSTSTGGENLTAPGALEGAQLLLNSRFHFEINRHDRDIIVGVDLLHLFPKIAYSVQRREIHLWYHQQSYVNNDQTEAVAITLAFALLVVLYCHYDLMSCDNRRLYHFLVRVSQLSFQWFFFNVRQIIIEFVMLLVSFVILLLTLIFADYNTSNQLQRNVLFWTLLIYHWLVMVAIVASSPDLIRQAFIRHLNIDPVIHDRTTTKKQQQEMAPRAVKSGVPMTTHRDIHTYDYFNETRGATKRRPIGQDAVVVTFGGDSTGHSNASTTTTTSGGVGTEKIQMKDEDFRLVYQDYIETDESRLSKQYMTSVLARHTVLLIIIMLSLLLVINFVVQGSFLLLLVLVIVSFIFLYEFIYHLFVCLLYALGRPDDVKMPLLFTLFLVGECLCLAFYIAWSIACLYLDFAQAYNSIYSEAFVVATTIVLVALLFVMVCQRINTHMDTIVRKYYINPAVLVDTNNNKRTRDDGEEV